jgi:glutamine cyclotransferase/GNAT superfamily N-acetyltransferase
MLYEALFWRGTEGRPPAAEALSHPELAKILAGWGRPGDEAVIAVSGKGEPIGAAWYRLWTEGDHSYGFVDEQTPELGIGVVREYRRQGVGSALLGALTRRAGREGFSSLSLSVEAENEARSLYDSLGFETVTVSDGGSLTMALDLANGSDSRAPAAALLMTLVLLVAAGEAALDGSPAGAPAGCSAWELLACPREERPCRYSYRVVASYPHDAEAFTQGLVFDRGVLYEGTGLRGQSSLRQVDLETGEVERIHSLPANYFGEGVTVFEAQVVQLTWQSNTGFVYDVDSFEQLGSFSYGTEGWGITQDGERLIVSDGSPKLYFWAPLTFEEMGRVEVRDGGEPVTQLNELEFVCGEVLANLWYSDSVARIDPQTGEVIGWIDLAGLLRPEERPASGGVLNGIAFEGQSGHLFVTGKLWPWLFEIEVARVDG